MTVMEATINRPRSMPVPLCISTSPSLSLLLLFRLLWRKPSDGVLVVHRPRRDSQLKQTIYSARYEEAPNPHTTRMAATPRPKVANVTCIDWNKNPMKNENIWHQLHIRVTRKSALAVAPRTANS